MEEQKETKQVKMKVTKGNGSQQEEKQQRLTYEQLNQMCGELYQQNQNLSRQLHQANLMNAYRRLDYLFAVLKYESVIKDSDFINSCVSEIKETMMPEDKDEEKAS